MIDEIYAVLHEAERDDLVTWLSEEIDPIYCKSCGACGESGCCTPSLCNCLYGDQYKVEYNTLVNQNEAFRHALKLAYSKIIGTDTPHGLDSCDNYRDWLTSLGLFE